MVNFNDVAQKFLEYNPNGNIALLQEAYAFADEAHRGQKRQSGEAYITHPLHVAMILAELKMDQETLIAGFLHDVVEDTILSLEDVRKIFGHNVAIMVNGLTKLSKLKFKSKEEHQAENVRKMFLAMAQDIRVLIIKLADRLHNMRTLGYVQKEEKQKRISRETLDIYAPLANRLGIYKLKWELEDLSFRYLEPEMYQYLTESLSKSRQKREEYIAEAIAVLQKKTEEMNIKVDIQGRPKHLYSIYQKMKKKHKDVSEIYDALAVRVIVDKIRDCYGILGMVHSIWKPIPGQFDDYIAVPKQNMYQSLHTAVIGPHGEPLEIQIRTWDMHHVSEYGIAAHWRYKEGKKSDRELETKLKWLRDLMEWQRDLKDASEFVETLKADIFSDTVFVYTPKGDVIELPAGSTPVDFAFRVHTQVGFSCVGAKVDQRIVPLDYKLQNGNIVEIITTKIPNGPNRDWLAFAATSQARNRIRHWFKQEQKQELIIKGREMLEREAHKITNFTFDLLKSKALLEIGRKHGLNTMEDIYAAIGDGVLNSAPIIKKLKPTEELPKSGTLEEELQALPSDIRAKPAWGRPTQGIRVRGIDNVLIRFANCCNPVPGDPIGGYISRGRGVTVHRLDCGNMEVLTRNESSRLVEVAWDEDFAAPFQVKLEIETMDRSGMLNDILNVLSELKINMNSINGKTHSNLANIEMLIFVKTREQLDYLVEKISHIKDVFGVRRTSQRMSRLD